MDYILYSTHRRLPLYLQALWRRMLGLPGARMISAPTEGHLPNEYWSYIDFQGDVYRLFWSGYHSSPDLSRFPTGCDFEHVRLSNVIAQTWKHSTLLAHGVDACIREDSETLPILKLAHPNHTARERLRHEFEVFQSMRGGSLPIPRIHPQPLVDSEGIYGYRMERLYCLDFQNLPKYFQAVEIALSKFHNAGFAIGDLHPGNVMLDENDRLVFIDLAHAGRLGEDIAEHVSADSYRLPVYHIEPDIERLARLFVPNSGHCIE